MRSKLNPYTAMIVIFIGAVAFAAARQAVSASNTRNGANGTNSTSIADQKKGVLTMNDIESSSSSSDVPLTPVSKTDAEWKQELTPNQYHILREKGTEYPFTGEYWNTKTKGTYVCAACGQELFSSETKFESGCGWPSFWAGIDKTHLIMHHDDSNGMSRTEVLCSRCGGHLGHVFDDGPPPTGTRFCINSGAVKLIVAK